MHIFSHRIIDKIMHYRICTLWPFIFSYGFIYFSQNFAYVVNEWLIFWHHIDTYSLNAMISFLCRTGSGPQLCRNRLKDVINLSNNILQLNIVQVYEFHGKLEKLKKTNLWTTTENKKKWQIKLCRKICREIIITHTAEPQAEPSQTCKMKPFVKMGMITWIFSAQAEISTC